MPVLLACLFAPIRKVTDHFNERDDRVSRSPFSIFTILFIPIIPGTIYIYIYIAFTLSLRNMCLLRRAESVYDARGIQINSSEMCTAYKQKSAPRSPSQPKPASSAMKPQPRRKINLRPN